MKLAFLFAMTTIMFLNVGTAEAKINIRVKMRGLKIEGKGILPEQLERLGHGVNQTIKRNSKVIGHVGRAVACYYTAYCASEIYIAYKKEEAAKKAKEDLSKFTKEGLRAAEAQGEAALLAFEQGYMAETNRLLQLQEELLANVDQRIKGLTELEAELKFQQELRRDWKAGISVRESTNEGSDASIAKFGYDLVEFHMYRHTPEFEVEMRTKLANRAQRIAEFLGVTQETAHSYILQQISEEAIGDFLWAVQDILKEESDNQGKLQLEWHQLLAKKRAAERAQAARAQGKK